MGKGKKNGGSEKNNFQPKIPDFVVGLGQVLLGFFGGLVLMVSIGLLIS